MGRASAGLAGIRRAAPVRTHPLHIGISTLPSKGGPMDFQPSERCVEFQERLTAFMDEHVYPAEAVYERQLRESGDRTISRGSWRS